MLQRRGQMEGTSFVGEVESIGDLLFQATISYAIRFTDPFGALNLTVAGCLGALQAIVGSSSTGITAGPNDGSTGIAISAANTASNAVAKAEKTDKEFTLRIQELEAKLDERDKTIDTLQGQLERHSRILRKASEKFTESEVRIEKLELGSKAPVLNKAQIDQVWKEITPRMQTMITASLPKPTPTPEETRTATPASTSKADLAPKSNALMETFAQKPSGKG